MLVSGAAKRVCEAKGNPPQKRRVFHGRFLRSHVILMQAVAKLCIIFARFPLVECGFAKERKTAQTPSFNYESACSNSECFCEQASKLEARLITECHDQPIITNPENACARKHSRFELFVIVRLSNCCWGARVAGSRRWIDSPHS